MNSLNSWIEYLKDPLLVANFQSYFGIKIKEYNLDLKKEKERLDNERFEKSNGDILNRKVKCSLSNNIKLTEDEDQNISSKNAKSNVNHSAKAIFSIGHHVQSKEEKKEMLKKYVTNKFWYYLFLFGTSLGDELFYAIAFSAWFWNIDGSVGRRVVLLWGLIMYIGQGLKDIIRWPRPASPVLRLEKKWELEYGFPSTHAMVGAAVPFSLIIFTSSRYEYSIEIGVICALVWCSVVCFSRIYLGMHTILDVICGLLLVALLFIPIIPLVDALDPILLKEELGGLYIFLGTASLAAFSPGGDRWTPARGDTMVILGSCNGLILGSWANYQLGIIYGPPDVSTLPYPVIWPSFYMAGLALFRLFLGLVIVGLTRHAIKSLGYTTIRTLILSKEISYITNASKKEVVVELAYKFLTYSAIGFNVMFTVPAIFRFLQISRPSFHTEI